MVYYIFYKIRLKRILINQIIKQALMGNENERVKSPALSHTTSCIVQNYNGNCSSCFLVFPSSFRLQSFRNDYMHILYKQ